MTRKQVDILIEFWWDTHRDALINLLASTETEHFKLNEFHKEGERIPFDYLDNLYKLMQQLEIIRSYFNDRPIFITSGYRTPEHNEQIGGAPNSTHLTASGCDLLVSGFTPEQVYEGIVELCETNMIIDGGVGKYDRHTHYDIGPKRRWRE